jgi:hypothetical protein
VGPCALSVLARSSSVAPALARIPTFSEVSGVLIRDAESAALARSPDERGAAQWVSCCSSATSKACEPSTCLAASPARTAGRPSRRPSRLLSSSSRCTSPAIGPFSTCRSAPTEPVSTTRLEPHRPDPIRTDAQLRPARAQPGTPVTTRWRSSSPATEWSTAAARSAATAAASSVSARCSPSRGRLAVDGGVSARGAGREAARGVRYTAAPATSPGRPPSPAASGRRLRPLPGCGKLGLAHPAPRTRRNPSPRRRLRRLSTRNALSTRLSHDVSSCSALRRSALVRGGRLRPRVDRVGRARAAIAAKAVLLNLEAHPLLLGERPSEHLLEPDRVHAGFHPCRVEGSLVRRCRHGGLLIDRATLGLEAADVPHSILLWASDGSGQGHPFANCSP